MVILNGRRRVCFEKADSCAVRRRRWRRLLANHATGRAVPVPASRRPAVVAVACRPGGECQLNTTGGVARHVAATASWKSLAQPPRRNSPSETHVDADLLLHVQHAQDLAIFDLSQLLERQAALLVRRARLLQLVGAQEAADLVGSIRHAHDAIVRHARQ